MGAPGCRPAASTRRAPWPPAGCLRTSPLLSAGSPHHRHDVHSGILSMESVSRLVCAALVHKKTSTL